jgi:hypothetical protein
MLFVDLEEAITQIPKGVPPNVYVAVMSPVINRLKEAQVFALDPTASAMCANVFFSRPSSIVSALPFVKLPAPLVWIEYSNIAASNAFAALGNENHWLQNGVKMERTGLLLKERGTLIEMEAVVQFRKEDGSKVIELLSGLVTFDTTEGRFVETPVETVRLTHNSKGAAKRYYDLISTDPKEKTAKMEIEARLEGEAHPDHDPVFELIDVVTSARTVAGHIADIKRIFTTQILPSLILLNCRNSVEQESVVAPTKLNKARRAKGKPEIGPYKIVKLHLRDKLQRRLETKGQTSKQIRGSFVIGHFKVRKTGVFWWSPHPRGTPTQAGRTVRLLTF